MSLRILHENIQYAESLLGRKLTDAEWKILVADQCEIEGMKPSFEEIRSDIRLNLEVAANSQRRASQEGGPVEPTTATKDFDEAVAMEVLAHLALRRPWDCASETIIAKHLPCSPRWAPVALCDMLNRILMSFSKWGLAEVDGYKRWRLTQTGLTEAKNRGFDVWTAPAHWRKWKGSAA